MAGSVWEEGCDSAEAEHVTRSQGRQVWSGIKDQVEFSGSDQAEGGLLAMVVSLTLF